MRRKTLDSVGKKGQMAFYILLFGMIVVFTFALVNIFTYKVFTEINDDMQNDPTLSNQTKETVDSLHTRFTTTFDSALLIIVVGYILISIAVGYFSYSHPALLVVYFIIACVLMLVAMNLSNTWDEVVSDPDMASAQTDFPITDYVLDNYLMVIGGGIFSVLVTMFLRSRYG